MNAQKRQLNRQLAEAYNDSSAMGKVAPYLLLALALFAIFVWRTASTLSARENAAPAAKAQFSNRT